MNIVVNTEMLKNTIRELENHYKYFLNKKMTFTNNQFGDNPKLIKYLTELQDTYNIFASNISSVTTYLNDYVSDLENLENLSSNYPGFIKNNNVYKLVTSYKNTIKNCNIEDNNLFEI